MEHCSSHGEEMGRPLLTNNPAQGSQVGRNSPLFVGVLAFCFIQEEPMFWLEFKYRKNVNSALAARQEETFSLTGREVSLLLFRPSDRMRPITSGGQSVSLSLPT